jgi:RNA polymerase sigma factor for flagellar operon FliA
MTETMTRRPSIRESKSLHQGHDVIPSPLDTISSGVAVVDMLIADRMVEIGDETTALWREYKANPTDELRNRLFERYMPLVESRAKRIITRLPDGVDIADLISAGNFGLMSAIAAFDLERGVKFETFCMNRVQGAIIDELRAMDWVPRMVRTKTTRLNDAYKQLETHLGRKPIDTEVAEYMQISLDEVRQLLAESHDVNLTSLDKRRCEGDSSKDIREIDVIADSRSEDPTERMAKDDLIRSFTRGLSKTERLIIILYYYEDMTMREIGMTLDLSESRVSQMHTAIVNRIKRLYMD